MRQFQIAVFDLDGTLIDSDEALVEPFLHLGLSREEITFGHPIEEFCRDRGIDVTAYVERYDTERVQPFAGATELVEGLGRWAICSNKFNESGYAELDRLGWNPEVALFSRDFGGAEKRLAPVLERLDVEASQVVYVGDSSTDRAVAEEAGCAFVWAGWNPRTAAANPDGTVLSDPRQVLDLLEH